MSTTTRNPNGDRIAALARQTGSPEAEVTAVIAGQYLIAADKHDDEQQAAMIAMNYAKAWLDIIGQTDEPSEREKEHGLALQNLLARSEDGYRAPLMRLLDAVAKGETSNPNPTPAFGSRK